MSYFKYVSECVCLKILDNQKIRITQANQFNDPFEILPTFIFSQPVSVRMRDKLLKEIESIIPDTPDYSSVHRTLYRALNNEINSFSEELNFNHIIKNIKNCMGILSLTTCNKNILMWSHYANSHKDVVIEFDEKNEFFKQDYFGKPTKVKYVEERILKSSLNFKLQELFFIKSKYWKYENELRMVVPIIKATNFSSRILSSPFNGKDENIYLLDIPNNLIKAIYFGAGSDFTHPTKTKILIRDELHKNFPFAKIYQGIVSKYSYSIDFEDITTFSNSW